MSYLLLGAGIVVFDQITKFLITRSMDLGQSIPLLPFIRLTYALNKGGAFGLFPGIGPVLAAVTALIIGYLLIHLHRSPIKERVLKLGVTFLIGGALGNLIDRLRFGKVVDFVDLTFWPVFNMADVAVVVGTILLAWHFWRQAAAPQAEAGH
ncbi:MAG: signal peptidase II [Firmicutes bacterium]|nr:signal peptidase II [Bacillota bacterium]